MSNNWSSLNRCGILTWVLIVEKAKSSYMSRWVGVATVEVVVIGVVVVKWRQKKEEENEFFC